MRKSRTRLIAFAAISAGVLFQSPVGGCAQFGAQLAVGVFDACAVLNCSSGTFFNFCTPTRILVDCPNAATTTTDDGTP